MKLRVLGCAGSESPGRKSPAFLIDDVLLLDGGIIGNVLTQSAQERIDNVLLTHAHHDHIRGLPSFADNLAVSEKKESVTIIGSETTLKTLKDHLFNDLIWPDFSRIPTPSEPIVHWQKITPQIGCMVGGYMVTAVPVNHSVPTLAYRIQKDGTSLLYTGDMGPTPALWDAIGTPTALIIEVSFPNHLEWLAIKTGHMTANLLRQELAHLATLPIQIFISHIKPYYEKEIHQEIAALGIPGLSILHDGQEILISAGESSP